MATVFTLTGSFGDVNLMPFELGGSVTTGNTVVPIAYNNWGLGDINIDDGVAKLNTAINGTAGVKKAFGHSAGAVVISKWLSVHGPTCTVPPSDLSFVCIGNSARKYGGFLWSDVNQFIDYLGREWIVTPVLPPANTPYTVTDLVNQYDGWADWPAGPWTNITALQNALQGQSLLHDYRTSSLTNPTNVPFVEGNITYIWQPTYPVPILGGGLLHPIPMPFLDGQECDLRRSTASRARELIRGAIDFANRSLNEADISLRRIIEAAYSRPVSMPQPG